MHSTLQQLRAVRAATARLLCCLGLLSLLLFFRTLILHNILWNIHFHSYLGGQSMSNKLLWQPSDCTIICYD